MRPAGRVGALAVALALITPIGAEAQSSVSVSGGATAIATSVSSEASALTEELSGITLGWEATFFWRSLELDVRYLQGSVDPSDAAPERDVVEGEALLGWSPRPWITVRLGPHIRSFITSDGTQRWVFWESRVRAATTVLNRVGSYFELWRVLASDVDAPESFDSGYGLEGGLRFAFSSPRLWLRVGYRLDSARLGGGTRSETVEHLMITLGTSLGR